MLPSSALCLCQSLRKFTWITHNSCSLHARTRRLVDTQQAATAAAKGPEAATLALDTGCDPRNVIQWVQAARGHGAHCSGQRLLSRRRLRRLCLCLGRGGLRPDRAGRGRQEPDRCAARRVDAVSPAWPLPRIVMVACFDFSHICGALRAALSSPLWCAPYASFWGPSKYVNSRRKAL